VAEEVNFTATVDPPVTRFRISLLALDWFNARIDIRLRAWDGTTFGPRELVASYSGAEATALMITLNKVNLATQSLHQRVITKLLADGKIPAGTSSGAPD
jgi:hypothetical protein